MCLEGVEAECWTDPPPECWESDPTDGYGGYLGYQDCLSASAPSLFSRVVVVG